MRWTMERSKWAVVAGLFGLAVPFGCEHPKPQTPAANNLHYVQCAKRLPSYTGVTEIVVNAKDGLAYEDLIIFVCAGEKVRWKADTGVKSIEISFQNQEWPFKETFEATLPGTQQTHTPDREVKDPPPTYRTKAYKYRIRATTDAGKTIDLDPNIMPMDD